MHIDDIITELESYLVSIDKPATVVEFGVRPIPQPPYIVVRQETGAFRFTGHMQPGQQEALRILVRKDIQDALFGKVVGGVRLELDPLATPSPIVGTNDDGTISQERLFIAADRLY